MGARWFRPQRFHRIWGRIIAPIRGATVGALLVREGARGAREGVRMIRRWREQARRARPVVARRDPITFALEPPSDIWCDLGAMMVRGWRGHLRARCEMVRWQRGKVQERREDGARLLRWWYAQVRRARDGVSQGAPSHLRSSRRYLVRSWREDGAGAVRGWIDHGEGGARMAREFERRFEGVARRFEGRALVSLGTESPRKYMVRP